MGPFHCSMIAQTILSFKISTALWNWDKPVSLEESGFFHLLFPGAECIKLLSGSAVLLPIYVEKEHHEIFLVVLHLVVLQKAFSF